MARAPDERYIKAYDMFKSGAKLIEIANQLSLPEGTVRRWKSTHKWDSERSDKKSERSDRKKNAHKEQITNEVKQVINNTELTDKQRLFCLYYIKNFNAPQSYAKAYGCTYETAAVNAYRLLANDSIKAELAILRELKLQQLSAGESDLVDIHMRIAFADMGEYAEFKGNKVRLKSSDEVDTQLIKEIKEGQYGISIKLLDRCNSFDWLDRFFLLNPMDRHKVEYDKRKFELDIIMLDMYSKKSEPSGVDAGNDNFIEALNGKVEEVWADDE
jgi:phage terminase small subunit